ncbi:MAG: ABC transporter ATP-binding protein [Chloroflexi bacterium]|nr:ABC transporter ATP-binding protein [Chloroflexota bacterium]
MVSKEIVRVVGVERVYRAGHEEVRALRSVDLTVHQGKMIALMGRSGSGKTTLLNIIGGLDRPTAGQVWIGGQLLSQLPDQALTELRRNQIGFVFQSFALIPVLSALENVELPMHIAGVPRGARHQRALDLLHLVGLTKRVHHRPFELSGGEQQRVGIARALANQPSLLLADEPTGELDSVTGLQILKLFLRIASDGVTVVIATHDPTVSEIAHETYDLVDGVLGLREPELAEIV